MAHCPPLSPLGALHPAHRGEPPYRFQLSLRLILHPSDVFHREVNPPVYPAEELPMEIGKYPLLLLEGEEKCGLACRPSCPSPGQALNESPRALLLLSGQGSRAPTNKARLKRATPQPPVKALPSE